VVGGCSLQGGIGTIPGTVLGALFLRVVIDGVSKIIKTGADVYEGLIVGVVVVFAVAFSQLEGRTRRRNFFAGNLGWVAVVNLSILAGALSALVGPKLVATDNSLEIGPFTLVVSAATFVFLLLMRSDLPRQRKLWATGGLAVLVIAAVIALDYFMPQYRHYAATRAIASYGGTLEQAANGTVVDLGERDIDDAKLEKLVPHLQNVRDLVELRLRGAQVTDDGLNSLAPLTTLRRLDVSSTEVTPDGVRLLSRELPDLDVTP